MSDCLQHFNGYDAVVGALKVTVVFFEQLNLVRQSLIVNAFVGLLELSI